MKKEIPTIATLIGITILSGTALSRVPQAVSANESVDDSMSVWVGSSCSMSASGGSFTDSITPAGSVSSPDTGTSDITVSCNDVNGWAIYAIGYGNDTEGNTNLTSASNNTIPTTGSGSYWSMKLAPTADTDTDSEVISSDYASFHSIPSSYTKVASMSSDTASADGSSLSTFYEVYAVANQTPGTYTGAVKYVLVHPSTAPVCAANYGNLDGTCVELGSTVVNFTGKGIKSITFVSTEDYETQVVSSSAESIRLLPGVEYKVYVETASGWQLDGLTTTAGNVISSTSGMSSYMPSSNASDVANFTASSSIICNPSGTTISSISCMQDISSTNNTAVLASMTEDAQYQLTDSRDGKTYWVSKLKDGNIWMTQNLDLDLTTTGLTNADTDLNSVTAWSSSSTYAPQATETTTSSSSTYTDTRSWDLGDYIYDGTTDSSCGTSATSYADCTSYGFSSASSLAANSTARHYHVGNLYQWNTATAGSGGTITSGEAQDSICPKGWRLPTGTSSGEFQALATAYSVGSTVQTLLNSPLYFVRGGSVYSGTLWHAGYYGYYWSSTPYMYSSGAYNLRFLSANIVFPSDANNRYFGFSVRCLAR